MAFANQNGMQIYDVEKKEYPEWSRGLNELLPRRYKQLTDAILGVTFRPRAEVTAAGVEQQQQSCYTVLWGPTWLCKVKLGDLGNAGVRNKKRPRDGEVDEADNNANDAADPINTTTTNPAAAAATGGGGGYLQEREKLGFKIITRYRPILFVDFLDSDELIVVEKPLLDVLTKLPPAYFKPKYGS